MSFSTILTESDEAHDLTPFVTELTFKDVDPGGYGGCSFNLHRKVDARSFENFSDIAIYDNDTGEQCGGGRLLRPGRGVDQYGNGVWLVEALGEGVAHAQERTVPMFYIDDSFESWHDGAGTSKSRKWEVGTSPEHGAFDAEDGLIFSIQQTTVGINAYSNADMYDLREYGLLIGGFYVEWRAGKSSGSNEIEMQLRVRSGGSDPSPLDIDVTSWPVPSSTVTRNRAFGGTGPEDWTGEYDRANLVFVRRNTELTPVETDYVIAKKIILQSIRLDRDGDEIENDDPDDHYKKLYVRSDEAVIDALARHCPRFELEDARIDEGSYEHTNLKFPDGVSTYGLFEHLMGIEANFTWAVWERKENGLWNFEWRERDTEVRYEFGDATDCAFEFTGGEEERITTKWYTGENTIGRYKADETVGDNPFAGRDIEPTATGQITIANGSNWDLEAGQAAEQDIENSQFAATAARAEITHRVFDRYTGRWIKPHMIKAGYLGRILNVRPQTDTLNNPDLADNEVILRVVSKDYSTAEKKASLELNAYTLDEARAIANLLAAS